MEQKKTRGNERDPAKWEAERVLFIAPSNYGKSLAIAKWVLSGVKSGRYSYQRILIFSPTHRSDPSQRLVIDAAIARHGPEWEQEHCFETVDEEVLTALYSGQKTIKDAGSIP